MLLWFVGKSVSKALICMYPCKQSSYTVIRLFSHPTAALAQVFKTTMMLTITYIVFDLGQAWFSELCIQSWAFPTPLLWSRLLSPLAKSQGRTMIWTTAVFLGRQKSK
jgi:hypothetical protein